MRTSLADVHCSIARTMERLADGWTALILRDVFCGITRFDQLQEDLGITRNVLSARLNRLVDDGVLQRAAYSEHPLRYDYLPTEKGRDLYPVVLALMAWGDRWAIESDGAPAAIHHTSCGHHATPTVVCDHCGEPLTTDDAIAVAGPGGRTARGTQILGPVLAARRDDPEAAQRR